jgi:hypothetical protein
VSSMFCAHPHDVTSLAVHTLTWTRSSSSFRALPALYPVQKKNYRKFKTLAQEALLHQVPELVQMCPTELVLHVCASLGSRPVVMADHRTLASYHLSLSSVLTISALNSPHSNFATTTPTTTPTCASAASLCTSAPASTVPQARASKSAAALSSDASSISGTAVFSPSSSGDLMPSQSLCLLAGENGSGLASDGLFVTGSESSLEYVSRTNELDAYERRRSSAQMLDVRCVITPVR